MGGFGSGKSYGRGRAWRSKKLKTTSLLCLSIPELIKLHKSNPDCSFTLKDIRLMVTDRESSIQLESKGEKKLLTNNIKVAVVPCNYGGFRYFGHCPICQKRVRTLYLYGQFFACRQCLRMGYPSQNFTLSYRLYLKRKKIGKLINDDEWNKPKWMRKKTFERLRSQYFDLDRMSNLADFFSVRNNYAVEKLYSMYGDVACVPFEIIMVHYGKNWEHDECDPDELWEKITKNSKGKLNKDNCH